jgi:hypothetical protein
MTTKYAEYAELTFMGKQICMQRHMPVSYTDVRVHTPIHTQTRTHAPTHALTHVHTHTQTHTHTHAHTHIHTHAHTQVWDTYGRLLYQGDPFDFAVTSVAWSPNGDLLAVGSQDTLQLCDRMGWAHSKVCVCAIVWVCGCVGDRRGWAHSKVCVCV